VAHDFLLHRPLPRLSLPLHCGNILYPLRNHSCPIVLQCAGPCYARLEAAWKKSLTALHEWCSVSVQVAGLDDTVEILETSVWVHIQRLTSVLYCVNVLWSDIVA
jgi:hypothetical protein